MEAAHATSFRLTDRTLRPGPQATPDPGPRPLHAPGPGLSLPPHPPGRPARPTHQPAHRRRTGLRPPHRRQWRERFVAAGLAGLQDAPRSGRPRSFSPDELVAVVNLASSKTEEHDQPATRWSLDDLAATIVNEAHHQAMSRSTIWRILDEADLKPHKSVYWLNSHDPDFDAKAQAICRLYLDAPRCYQQGRLVICCDEKTGMQILRRKYPTRPAEPGKPEKREFEYIRHGTRALITSFACRRARWSGTWGRRAPAWTWAGTSATSPAQFHQFERFDWVVDNLNTHWSLEVCRVDRGLQWCAFQALGTCRRGRSGVRS